MQSIVSKIFSIMLMIASLQSCVMKFEVPSNKSKLEKQVLGFNPTVKKEELRKIIVRSSIDRPSDAKKIRKLREMISGQVKEMIRIGTLGETYSGKISVLSPDRWSVAYDPVLKSQLEDLAEDENYTREQLSKIEDSEMLIYRYSGIKGGWYENAQKKWGQ